MSWSICQCLFGDQEDVINQKSRCCSISSDFDPLSNNNMPMPPGPPRSHPPRTSDIERMSEKYWGEILERTLSSSSLHALQQSFSGQRTPLAHHNNRFNHSPSMLTNQTSVLSLNHIARDNGLEQQYWGKHNHYRHSSYLDNGDAHLPVGNHNHLNGAAEGDDEAEDDDEGEEEEEEENGDIEEEETSNSDSAQDDRGGGPRVSFLSNSETRLNDFSIHDKNCAKAKMLNAQIESVKGLPGI